MDFDAEKPETDAERKARIEADAERHRVRMAADMALHLERKAHIEKTLAEITVKLDRLISRGNGRQQPH